MEVIKEENIQNQIFSVRGIQVMLDSDLAKLYQTETKFINRAVKRNPMRFPESFAFQLSEQEWEALRFQNGTLNDNVGRGQHRKYLPWVFTEQGVAMLSAVLNTERAILASIQIIQAFVAMRNFLLNNASVFHRLNQVELKQLKTDEKLEQVLKH
jgi:phage regulator Rha-like protein